MPRRHDTRIPRHLDRNIPSRLALGRIGWEGGAGSRMIKFLRSVYARDCSDSSGPNPVRWPRYNSNFTALGEGSSMSTDGGNNDGSKGGDGNGSVRDTVNNNTSLS
uniref:Uncharacterized protein n=1 Tax=Oryza brachyantha TaxID=4533 RepID=J3MFB8_ORYBR